MLKKASFFIMLVALALVVAACGSSDKNNEKPAGNSSKGAEQTGDAAAEVTIKASNYEFDQPTYTIKKGEPTKFTLDLLSGIHGVKIDKLGLVLEENGATQVITADQAGEYELYCSITCGPGHSKMKAKLIVE